MFREISGDQKLTAVSKIYYLLLNLIQGIIGNLHPCFSAAHYNIQPMDIGKYETRSPARVYIDVFLKKILEMQAGKIKSVLDVCGGSGYLRNHLEAAGFEGHYTCVDIKKHDSFDRFYSETISSYLAQERIEDFLSISRDCEGFDLCISITAMEHIENDLHVIDDLSKLLKDNNIEIHIVPASPSLFLYLWHGYRQYSKKRILRILALRDYSVYKFGGVPSFFVHLFFVTFMEVFLKVKVRSSRAYAVALRRSVELDKYFPYFAYTYALVRVHPEFLTSS